MRSSEVELAIHFQNSLADFPWVAQLLHQALAKREQLIRDLTELDIIYPSVFKALRRRRSIHGALFYAHLHNFLELEPVSPDGRVPLVQADAFLNTPMIQNAAPGAPHPSFEVRANDAAA